MSDIELAGRTVILTGATGGIGLPLARAFAQAGARVGAIDQDEARLAALQDELGAEIAIGVRCDVSDAADCRRAVAAIAERFGAVHGLVNNAALGMNAVHPDYDRGELQIEDVPDELWARFMAVNVNGPFFMTRAVMPHLRAGHWGRIVNISTSYLTMMRKGFAPYGPTKAALEAWTLMLSRQLEGSGITANIVLPGGPVDTAMVLDSPELDRSTLIAPGVMVAPVLALFADTAGTVSGGRFIAVDWDPALGNDPSAQRHRAAAWPELGAPFSKMRAA